MIRELLGLLTRDDVPIPLTGVEVFADITGRGARIRLRQSFKNVENEPIEAVYKFPLPEDSSVCGFKVFIGEKIIEGELEEREKAFELYDEALSEGHGAYLLDEERPNIFTLSVGNLNPGDSATIEIIYVTLLDTNGSEVRFFLPTTISPRYIPDDTKDRNGIPIESQVNPVYSLNVSYGLKVCINIHGKEGISSIESPSYLIKTKFDNDYARVEFAAETAKMDRDFILTITYKNGFESKGFICRNGKEDFVQIDFACGIDEVEETQSHGKEIIFVLDCSGSMGGSSIAEAKKALEIFLRGLEQGIKFNIYRFGSTFRKAFSSSVPYTRDSLNWTFDYLSKIEADLGGTEVLAPLKDIYQNNIPSDSKRDVILITDGEIGNESEVISLVRGKIDTTRLFTVGIGYGPNEYLIRQLAQSANGASELIAPGERIEPKILRLFKKVATGRIDNLKINWGVDVEQAPLMPVVFKGETTSVFVRVKVGENIPKSIVISGKAGENKKEWTVPLQEVKGIDIPVPVLWAREMIRELEGGSLVATGSKQTERKEETIKERIVSLSKKYVVISRETSFVAVEKRLDKEKTSGEVVLRKVPVMLTEGWGEAKYDVCCDIRDEADFDAPHAKPAADKYKDEVNDILLNILSLQRVEGGFIIDEDVAEILGLSIDEIKEFAKRIKAKGAVDNFLLLSTAIILCLLEIEFAKEKNIWSGVIQKSQKWLEMEIKRTEPIIEGKVLWEWVEDFVKKNISI